VGVVCGYVLLELLVDAAVDLVEFRRVCRQVERFDLRVRLEE